MKEENDMNQKKIKWSLLQVCIVPKNREDESFLSELNELMHTIPKDWEYSKERRGWCLSDTSILEIDLEKVHNFFEKNKNTFQCHCVYLSRIENEPYFSLCSDESTGTRRRMPCGATKRRTSSGTSGKRRTEPKSED